MASGGGWQGREDMYEDNSGRHNIQLNDQRFHPGQPRREPTVPLQEGFENYGQATLDFQSIPATDGYPTIHQGIPESQPAVNNHVAANSQQTSRNNTIPAIDQPFAAVYPTTRPYGSELVEQDDLPLCSNGGHSLTSMMAGLTIQEQPSDMRNQCAREESFKTAPIIFTSIAQLNPQLLAENGFYYTGKDDEVMCFSCGTGLREWEQYDDPLIEHIKYGPEEICQHLQLIYKKEELQDIQASLTAGKTGLKEPMREPTPDFKFTDDTTYKEHGDRYSNFSTHSGHFACAAQGSPKTFMCYDCHKNVVNHTQLRCGHGICDSCIKLSKIPMQERVCTSCKQPVIGYVPYSPGCQ